MSRVQPRLRSRILSAFAAAAYLLVGAVFVAPVFGGVLGMKVAQIGLPEGPSISGPVRRGTNGQIETVDPTKQNGKDPRRCSAGSICTGPEQAYPTLTEALSVAPPGAVIELVAGTYRGAIVITRDHVTIRGVGGTPHFDCANFTLAENKACILLAADGITLENLEISGAVLPDSLGANGACVRNEPDLSFTLRRISCHGSQDGLLTNGGSVVIEESEFYDNGWTGQTHNVYFSGHCLSVTVRGSIFRDARVGHEFKSRCAKTEISELIFRSTHGSRNLDIPDGGETIVYRSTLLKTPGAESQQIVGFTPESCTYSGNMTLKNIKIVNSRPDADIQNFDRCEGKAIVFQGVTVEGMPFKEFGYILRQ